MALAGDSIAPSPHSAFMNVRQVAEYLHLNEKKIYTLVGEGGIPATKVTGKWMFPKELIDRWMLDSSHGGLLTDRLTIAGGDDPLLQRLLAEFSEQMGDRALIGYTPTGTRLGLELLQSHRVDACGIHWGPDDESALRHPALLRLYHGHGGWVLIRLFRREQGLMLSSRLGRLQAATDELFQAGHRWALRQNGAGTQRFLMEILSRHQVQVETLHKTVNALSEREAAAAICMDQADIAPGARAVANEHDLRFISFGWESFDLALPRGIWFRSLFQSLLESLKSSRCQQLADALEGYDLCDRGELIWGDE